VHKHASNPHEKPDAGLKRCSRSDFSKASRVALVAFLRFNAMLLTGVKVHDEVCGRDVINTVEQYDLSYSGGVG
jgi:hypothetical protein